MSERLEQIKARLEAATPGPWEWDWQTLGSDIAEVAEPVLHCGPYCIGGSAKIDIKVDDAQFIAHSREDVAWLIEQLEAVKAPTRAKCTFEWRCQDCDEAGTGATMAEVREHAVEHWHRKRWIGHRVQVCGWDGWVRP